MNWGKGIVIALAAFISFIMYMVIQMYQKNVDLVEKDFYEQGVNIDSRIQATENALEYANEFVLNQTAESVQIIFPSSFDMKNAKGIIHFYRPENASLDRKYEIQFSGNYQEVKKSELTVGNFILKYDFSIGEKEYYFEKKIFVKK